MLVWPDISADWKEVDREPDPYARSQAFSAFERLDRMSAADLGATIDVYDETRPYVRFDPEALVIFRDWRAGFEKRIRSGDLHPAIESHLSKYRKLIPALALVHHFAHGSVGSVGALSLLAALSWGEFLEAHAMRVYGAALDSRRDGAREIARHIKRGDLGSSFTAREVQQKDWSGLPDAQHVGDAIDLLEELGWLRVKSIPTGGRPSTVCTVNPKVITR